MAVAAVRSRWPGQQQLARQGLLLCLLAAALLGAANAAGAYSEGPLFTTEPPQGRRCASLESIPAAGADLTAVERELLPFICWPTEEESVQSPPLQARRGFPPGVNCTVTQW